MKPYVCSMENIRLVHDQPGKASPLAERRIAVGCHLERWLRAERLWPLFMAFGQIYVVNDHRYTDRQLLSELLSKHIDTFIVNEYAGHTNARSRLLRRHGIRYWHYGLGIIDHYTTSRFDWGMYDDDTWLRYTTSPEQMPADDATETGDEVKDILVIGQVPGDQALQYGGRGYDMSLLIRETRMLMPAAVIRYRPHPRTLERVEFAHSFPDTYMLHPDDDIPILIDPQFTDELDKIQKRYPLAKLQLDGTLTQNLEQADAAVMVNSTAAYEAVQQGVTAYIAGIPLFDLHDGGIALLGNICNGKHIPSADYAFKLTTQLLKMQSTPDGIYDPYQFKEHERTMLRALCAPEQEVCSGASAA